MGDGEAGQVRGAVGEEFGGPDAQHDPRRPGACGVGRGGGDGGGDAPHDGFGVVGELVWSMSAGLWCVGREDGYTNLYIEEEPDGFVTRLGEVFENVL